MKKGTGNRWHCLNSLNSTKMSLLQSVLVLWDKNESKFLPELMQNDQSWTYARWEVLGGSPAKFRKEQGRKGREIFIPCTHSPKNVHSPAINNKCSLTASTGQNTCNYTVHRGKEERITSWQGWRRRQSEQIGNKLRQILKNLNY